MRPGYSGTAIGLALLAGIAAADAEASGLRDAAAPWAGPYVGAFAGHGWGRARATAPFDANTGFWYNFGGDPYAFDANGPFAGAVAGHNWQSGRIVFGIEGEVGYLGLDGSILDPNGVARGWFDTTTSFRSDLYGGLFARLGIAHGNALAFVRGGAALLEARASTIDPLLPSTTLRTTGRRTMAGWSVGGGGEWAFASRWTARAEYAYFDFGRITTAGPSSVPGEFYRQRIDVTAHTVRAAVLYRFDLF